ncbi:MAG TPA: LON peptidase substrate-binding domain-containing protein [Candidatus Didemnitutus sp.]|nr:LON peptidase substrate-binding domain-containing protein [Candidatus Didemnitutus sp.]
MDAVKVPPTLPVMTLPRTVFFPQALLPLHIFEPRYREMLRDVLATTRIFAVARLDPSRAAESDDAAGNSTGSGFAQCVC